MEQLSCDLCDTQCEVLHNCDVAPHQLLDMVDGLWLCRSCQKGYEDVQIEEISTPEGVNLESVGTYIRADGWCFPMTIDGGYFDDEGVAIHIRDCDPEDEGYEWWQNLSPEDRKIAEEAKAKGSE